MLTATLLALWFQQRSLPPVEPISGSDSNADAPEATSLRESMHLVVGTPHLRNIALIVGAATMASFMVDYQFKGVAAAHFGSEFRASRRQAGDPIDPWEVALELTYQFRVFRSSAFQPDFQYVIQPGGNRAYDDAVVLGARWIQRF